MTATNVLITSAEGARTKVVLPREETRVSNYPVICYLDVFITLAHRDFLLLFKSGSPEDD